MIKIIIVTFVALFIFSGCIAEESPTSEESNITEENIIAIEESNITEEITITKIDSSLYGKWRWIHDGVVFEIVSTTEFDDGYTYQLTDDNLLEFHHIEDDTNFYALRSAAAKSRVFGSLDILQEITRGFGGIGDISVVLKNINDTAITTTVPVEAKKNVSDSVTAAITETISSTMTSDETATVSQEVVEAVALVIEQVKNDENATSSDYIAQAVVAEVNDTIEQSIATFIPILDVQALSKKLEDAVEVAISNAQIDESKEEYIFEDDSLPAGDYILEVVQSSNPTVPIATYETKIEYAKDLGVTTVVEEIAVKHNFKASVNMDSDSRWDKYIYGDYETTYTGEINIQNIGEEEGSGLSYEVFSNNKYIHSMSAENSLGTLPPGSIEAIPFTVNFKYIDNIYENVKINVKIKDRFGNEWNEYVTLKVYKRPVRFNIVANEATVNGYLSISEDELIKLDVRSDGFYIPYNPEKIYYLYLSNPSIANETTYSVGIDSATLNMDEFRDTGSYEENDNKATASTIEINEAIVSYLHKGDLDVYKIDMSDSEEIQEITSLHYHSISPIQETSNVYDYIDADGNSQTGQYITLLGNDDGILNKGESVAISLAIENKGSSKANSVEVVLTTTDAYLTTNKLSAISVDFEANEVIDTNGYNSTSSVFLTDSTNYANDFIISADINTPDGHIATIDMTMTDEFGNVWTDSFTITVEDVGADLHYHSISPIQETSNVYDYIDADGNSQTGQYITLLGNDDGILNKGESVAISLAIENKGSSKANSVEVVLTTTDAYLTTNKLSAISVDFEANEVIDTNGYNSTSSVFLTDSTNYANDFIISADINTPDGHVATIDMTMTDEFGNVWTDSFTVTVYAQ